MMITDLNMPGMDGFELALLAKEFSPHMEIVIATGEASQDVFRFAAEIGISLVLEKPYILGELREIVSTRSTHQFLATSTQM
jgi:CheY-like chemotaxis protein